jgi:hypothetical protein
MIDLDLIQVLNNGNVTRTPSNHQPHKPTSINNPRPSAIDITLLDPGASQSISHHQWITLPHEQISDHHPIIIKLHEIPILAQPRSKTWRFNKTLYLTLKNQLKPSNPSSREPTPPSPPHTSEQPTLDLDDFTIQTQHTFNAHKHKIDSMFNNKHNPHTLLQTILREAAKNTKLMNHSTPKHPIHKPRKTRTPLAQTIQTERTSLSVQLDSLFLQHASLKHQLDHPLYTSNDNTLTWINPTSLKRELSIINTSIAVLKHQH